MRREGEGLRSGGPYHVTYPMMCLMYQPPPCEQTDTCENITFSQLRLRVAKKEDDGDIEDITDRQVLNVNLSSVSNTESQLIKQSHLSCRPNSHISDK